MVTGIRGPFRASEPPASENLTLPSKFVSEQKAQVLKCSEQLGYLQFLSNPQQKLPVLATPRRMVASGGASFAWSMAGSQAILSK